nr:hypothetical protein Iba_chr09cCG2640 [Ipomoea batatas]
MGTSSFIVAYEALRELDRYLCWNSIYYVVLRFCVLIPNNIFQRAPSHVLANVDSKENITINMNGKAGWKLGLCYLITTCVPVEQRARFGYSNEKSEAGYQSLQQSQAYTTLEEKKISCHMSGIKNSLLSKLPCTWPNDALLASSDLELTLSNSDIWQNEEGMSGRTSYPSIKWVDGERNCSEHDNYAFEFGD